MKKMGARMRKAYNNDILDILNFLKDNISDCIYMYIDIAKYGVNSTNISVWLDDTKGCIKTVVMSYYDSLQIYSNNLTNDIEWIITLIRKQEYSMVSGNKEAISALEVYLQDYYNSEFGEVYQVTKYRLFETNGMIENAKYDDMREIAELICSDPAFCTNYQVDILEKQLKNRLQNGMGRNLIIKEQGQIVAHIATYAEYEDIVVTSGLIVRSDCRKKMYGLLIESYLVNELLEENKKIYTFILDEKRAALLNAMGAHKCAEYGKLTKCL